MEMQWEHKIKEAFHKRDENSSFKNKDNLWKRISENIGKSKGIPVFWRAAAIVLAFLFMGGAFASITRMNEQKNKLAESRNTNRQLHLIIDSLQNTEPVVVTETQFIEKEKIVYREIQSLPKAEEKEQKINELQNDNLQLREQITAAYNDLKTVRDSLRMIRIDLESKPKFTQTITEHDEQRFTLKTERVKEQLQPVSSELAPPLRVQLLKIQDKNIRYETNSTLLKK